MLGTKDGADHFMACLKRLPGYIACFVTRKEHQQSTQKYASAVLRYGYSTLEFEHKQDPEALAKTQLAFSSGLLEAIRCERVLRMIVGTEGGLGYKPGDVFNMREEIMQMMANAGLELNTDPSLDFVCPDKPPEQCVAERVPAFNPSEVLLIQPPAVSPLSFPTNDYAELVDKLELLNPEAVVNVMAAVAASSSTTLEKLATVDPDRLATVLEGVDYDSDKETRPGKRKVCAQDACCVTYATD